VAEYQVFDHDVLVIGAGGAGLRAAIEASAAGVKVGVVSKSLLGKAHTVMAEGGVAAAMGNVDERDNWRVHFADTMRGGQYLNDWRMAELHASAEEISFRLRILVVVGMATNRIEPAMKNREPAIRNGGRVSIAYLIARYVEPQKI